jgi:hypothetical protein
MPEYKAAKEAFVADNLGASIWSINAVSLFGLVSCPRPLSSAIRCAVKQSSLGADTIS